MKLTIDDKYSFDIVRKSQQNVGKFTVTLFEGKKDNVTLNLRMFRENTCFKDDKDI